ncbi:MAG: tetratricopeptide repeat protein [Candidatus Aminicenantes bacterium]|nr:tetratricopeptide repeat protein [Candidatus Aminicenantes bacterium]MDH5466087.1 tetratricopeptide repeat protein [Candidatus Aminicenantes bacterium]MDH5706019.1 tetratricopeptide repeat protein [Candidatus Aminicenantes bacterium]
MIYKKIKLYALILIAFTFILSGCSRSYKSSQIKFGIFAAQNDLWEEAIFRWKKAVQLNPESAAAHNNLAVAYEKKGLLDEAEKEYETALKLNPKNSYIKANFENFKKNLVSQDEDEKKEKKDEKK